MMGRTENDCVMNFPGQPRLAGTFVEVRITEACPHSLRGEFLDINDAVRMCQRAVERA
jgi:tRNA-2-methylthio-N6-dimethylallyladenosine synthase